MNCPYSQDTDPKLFYAYQRGVEDATAVWSQDNPQQPCAVWLKIGHYYSVCSNCRTSQSYNTKLAVCPVCKAKMIAL